MTQQQLFESGPLPSVRLTPSFEELLGKTQKDMPGNIRRSRWNKWLEMARMADPEIAEWWLTTDGCVENGRCIYLDGDDCWCKQMELPASVNPILSFRTGLLGMACMGMGHTTEKK